MAQITKNNKKQGVRRVSVHTLCLALCALIFATVLIHGQSLAAIEETYAGLQELLVNSHSDAAPSTVMASKQQRGLNDKLTKAGVWAELVWEHLLKEGSALLKSNQNPGVVMEVGMHRARQCIQAAQAGLQAHCVEPSPSSFEIIKQGVAKRAPPACRERIHLYNVAAGESSGGTVPFTATGGTGDHVGQHDMWNMKEDRSAANLGDKVGKVIEVPSVRLDDIVNKTGKVFLLKVDTQGFEPQVFSGLTESLNSHQIQYILFEYWPRGMDLLAGKKDACIGVELLESLVQAGYTLYALPVMAHPRAPKGYKKVHDRPFDDLRANCKWYFELEERFPSAEYKMGYWTDVLAVAPNAKMEQATTKVGRALQS